MVTSKVVGVRGGGRGPLQTTDSGTVRSVVGLGLSRTLSVLGGPEVRGSSPYLRPFPVTCDVPVPPRGISPQDAESLSSVEPHVPGQVRTFLTFHCHGSSPEL